MPSFLNPEAPSGDIRSREGVETTPSDRHLIKLVAKGDEPAFADLYSRHNVAVFNYLLRLVNERPVAEDLLQDVFIAVWKGADRFRGRAKVKTYIFRIAHNQAVSWLRKNNRGKLKYEQVEVPEPAGPEIQSQAAWNRLQVQEALKELSTNHRAVVELSFVNGLSYAEISQVLDCPVGTVKSRMSYALQRLERLLKWKGLDE